MGENGLANNILNTAGDVANTMIDTAKSIGESIFGSKADEVNGVTNPITG